MVQVFVGLSRDFRLVNLIVFLAVFSVRSLVIVFVGFVVHLLFWLFVILFVVLVPILILNFLFLLLNGLSWRIQSTFIKVP